MKKILFLLLSTVAMYGQVPADATPLENIQITNNTTDNSATKVNVQSTDGTINTISKADLVNVVEVNDVPSLPLVGEVGKIYVVKNVNKIYRWNGTFYQELAGSDISGLQAQIDLKENLKENVITVAKSGGDYTSVQDAVNASVSGDVILIYPGIYNEKVNTVDKNISLIGVDKDKCIIKTTTGNYNTPPLECSGGLYAQNLTFLATSETPDAHTLYAYAVHMDFYGSGVTEFFNCRFESHQNAALGVGTHQDQTLILSSCDIVKKSTGNSYPTSGALYFHNSPNPETNQKLIVKNCRIVSDLGQPVRIDDARLNNGGIDTTTTVNFINNSFFTTGENVSSSLLYSGNTGVDGGLVGYIKLTDNSQGNNIEVLNSTTYDLIKTRGVQWQAFDASYNEFRMFNNAEGNGDLKLYRVDGANIFHYDNDKKLTLGDYLGKTRIVGGGISTSLVDVSTKYNTLFSVANPELAIATGYLPSDDVYIQALNTTYNISKDLFLNPFGGSVDMGGKLKATVPVYTNDTAADADATLLSGQFYKLTGSRVVYQKP